MYVHTLCTIQFPYGDYYRLNTGSLHKFSSWKWIQLRVTVAAFAVRMTIPVDDPGRDGATLRDQRGQTSRYVTYRWAEIYQMLESASMLVNQESSVRALRNFMGSGQVLLESHKLAIEQEMTYERLTQYVLFVDESAAILLLIRHTIQSSSSSRNLSQTYISFP
jgi:hypothetical protein